MTQVQAAEQMASPNKNPPTTNPPSVHGSKREPKIEPVLPRDCGLRQHRIRDFDAMVKAEYKDRLEDPALWTHMGQQFQYGSEIRCVAEDDSFVARLFVRYAQGSTVRVKLLDMVEFDEELPPQEDDPIFEIQLCGPKKYCIRRKDNGEFIKEYIPDKVTALRELNDLIGAMKR